MIDLLQEGVTHFNSSRYYEAHESWEDLWRETEGEARAFYQGLVQVAVGLHHLSRGNLGGGERVLRRGVEKLRVYPDSYRGLDNALLMDEIESVLSGNGSGRIEIRAAS